MDNSLEGFRSRIDWLQGIIVQLSQSVASLGTLFGAPSIQETAQDVSPAGVEPDHCERQESPNLVRHWSTTRKLPETPPTQYDRYGRNASIWREKFTLRGEVNGFKGDFWDDVWVDSGRMRSSDDALAAVVRNPGTRETSNGWRVCSWE